MQYSEELRAKVIERALTGEMTQEVLAEEFGVGRSTVQNWMRQHRVSGAAGLTGKDKRPQAWTREQRLEALLATHGLSEQELGAWCRQRGIHSHHLSQWRGELIGAAPENASTSETRALRQENRALKKELRRKDKALAETAALLVLKKKAASIWGESEDD